MRNSEKMYMMWITYGDPSIAFSTLMMIRAVSGMSKTPCKISPNITLLDVRSKTGDEPSSCAESEM